MNRNMSDTFVIVGAALAGAKAAETLREEGFDGEVVLLGAEPHRPYERPPLSKDYLRGEAERDAAFVHEEGFYAEKNIELRTSPVARRSTPTRARSSSRAGSASATRSCCWRPAPSRGCCRCPAPTSTACTTCATFEDSDTLREAIEKRRPRGRHRRRLDRLRGRRLGPHQGHGRHAGRAALVSARARDRPRGRRDLRGRSTATTAPRCSAAPASRRSRATGAPSACG